jgi:hypothetical protein
MYSSYPSNATYSEKILALPSSHPANLQSNPATSLADPGKLERQAVLHRAHHIL